MPQTKILIDLRYINSHSDLAFRLAPAFSANQTDTVFFEINLNARFLYSDFLILIASTVQYLRNNGIQVNGRFIDFKEESNVSNYASRVNFFKILQFEYKENFSRRNPRGRFTEIKEFNSDNVLDIFNEIMRILLLNRTDEDMLTALDYCLWEVMDNTLNHAGEDFGRYEGRGLVCAQYFPATHEVRLMIVDNGKGIHKALTTHPNSDYKEFSDTQAVERCIEKGVTNSEGRGFGLWATSELVRENRGQLAIHSGGHRLNCSNIKQVGLAPIWQGTTTFLRINTDVPVNHRVIFGEDSNLKEEFIERRDKLFGNLDELW